MYIIFSLLFNGECHVRKYRLRLLCKAVIFHKRVLNLTTLDSCKVGRGNLEAG